VILPQIGTYLASGLFHREIKPLERSQEFFDQVKDSSTAPNLIVDLRNNGRREAAKLQESLPADPEPISNRKSLGTIQPKKLQANAEQVCALNS